MKITSKEHATKVIVYVSKVFIVIGIIQSIFSFLILQGFLDQLLGSISGSIYIIFGLLLWKFKKLIFALLLTFFAFVNALLSILNLFADAGENKGLPIIGIALIFAGFQAIKATRAV